MSAQPTQQIRDFFSRQIGFYVVSGIVLQGYILINVSLCNCTIVWMLVCFHVWRQLWCHWRMWCYWNNITCMLCHLLKVMWFMTTELFHRQLINSICVLRTWVWKCLEKAKRKEHMHIDISTVQLYPKLAFKAYILSKIFIQEYIW